jgi:hypothetical protein
MGPDELFQFGHEICGTTRLEVCLDPILDRLGPKLLQCGDGSLGERLVREVGEGRPPPEGQSRRELAARTFAGASPASSISRLNR